MTKPNTPAKAEIKLRTPAVYDVRACRADGVSHPLGQIEQNINSSSSAPNFHAVIAFREFENRDDGSRVMTQRNVTIPGDSVTELTSAIQREIEEHEKTAKVPW